MVVADAEMGDGLDAYNKLKERFQSESAATTAALFQGVLEYRQGEVNVAKHVTNWKDLLRKRLQAADKERNAATQEPKCTHSNNQPASPCAAGIFF